MPSIQEDIPSFLENGIEIIECSDFDSDSGEEFQCDPSALKDFEPMLIYMEKAEIEDEDDDNEMETKALYAKKAFDIFVQHHLSYYHSDSEIFVITSNLITQWCSGPFRNKFLEYKIFRESIDALVSQAVEEVYASPEEVEEALREFV